jgi:hypothetical protein
LKLFWPAHASISVPSTVKCSSDKRRWAWLTPGPVRKTPWPPRPPTSGPGSW